jgi:hypothetical protein
MFSSKALTLLLVYTSLTTGLNTYPVTDTDQVYCYDSASSGGDDGGDPPDGGGPLPGDGGGRPDGGRPRPGDGAGAGPRPGGRRSRIGGGGRALEIISCDATGQDASYTTLPKGYRDNGDDTVTDMNTGLMWTQTLR